MPGIFRKTVKVQGSIKEAKRIDRSKNLHDEWDNPSSAMKANDSIKA